MFLQPGLIRRLRRAATDFTGLTDNFNRTVASGLGDASDGNGAWEYVIGASTDWSVANPTVVPIGTDGVSALAVRETNLANCTIGLKFTPAGEYAGIPFRWVGNTGYFAYSYYASNAGERNTAIYYYNGSSFGAALAVFRFEFGAGTGAGGNKNPFWLRLVLLDSVVTPYFSFDGSVWTARKAGTGDASYTMLNNLTGTRHGISRLWVSAGAAGDTGSRVSLHDNITVAA